MHVRFDNLTSAEQRRARAGQMRAFVWEHWQARQPAIVNAEYVSKEGKQTDISLEIKLVSSTLLLTRTYTRYRYGYDGQIFKRNEPQKDVYTVQRIVAHDPCPLDWAAKVTVLPSKAALSGADYCLRLVGWGGDVEGFL